MHQEGSCWLLRHMTLEKKLSAHHCNLNSLRYKMASTKDTSLARIPPCEDSFKQHVLRSQWQCKIWLSSHITKPDIGSPLSHGWKSTDSGLQPVLFEGITATELLDDFICSCSVKQACSTCSCAQQNLPCIEYCTCLAFEHCQNPLTNAIDAPSDSDEDIQTQTNFL